jgi:hypothetical protein
MLQVGPGRDIRVKLSEAAGLFHIQEWHTDERGDGCRAAMESAVTFAVSSLALLIDRLNEWPQWVGSGPKGVSLIYEIERDPDTDLATGVSPDWARQTVHLGFAYERGVELPIESVPNPVGLLEEIAERARDAGLAIGHGERKPTASVAEGAAPASVQALAHGGLHEDGLPKDPCERRREYLRRIIVEDMLEDPSQAPLFLNLMESLLDGGWEIFSPGGSVQRYAWVLTCAALYGSRGGLDQALEDPRVREATAPFVEETRRRARARGWELEASA